MVELVLRLYCFFSHVLSFFLRVVCSLEEECFVGRHLFMSMVFGLFQVIMYVLCLPLLSVFFMWRNHRNLDKHVVRTRYGLFLGGYRDDRYFWEIVLVA